MNSFPSLTQLELAEGYRTVTEGVLQRASFSPARSLESQYKTREFTQFEVPVKRGLVKAKFYTDEPGNYIGDPRPAKERLGGEFDLMEHLNG
jgi:hypothetical protein